jgi:nucleotide-binding universal stress UspA family protein
MNTPKEILVPTDFSETSNQALAFAQALGVPFDATIHLLYVVPDPHAEPWSIEATGMNLGSLLETWQTDAERRLGELTLTDLPHKCTTKIGQPYKQIISYVNDNDIDLIVMGTHGRGAIEHMLLGSVAEKVVRTAPCPVLTVRKSG